MRLVRVLAHGGWEKVVLRGALIGGGVFVFRAWDLSANRFTIHFGDSTGSFIRPDSLLVNAGRTNGGVAISVAIIICALTPGIM